MLKIRHLSTSMAGLFDRIAPPEEGQQKRTLGMLDLTSLGIAAIIGAGIFFLLGAESVGTGPAVLVSLLLGGVMAALAAFSYAEAAARIPGKGSAYQYAFVAFGRLPAFITGWLFVNAYVIGNASVAQAWSPYFVTFTERFGMVWSEALTTGPYEGGIVDIPAIVLMVAVAALVAAGVETGKRVNNALVVLKLVIVLMVIGIGAFLVDSSNWTPFSPGGWKGIAGSTAVLFFAFLGFDTIATTGSEAKNPRRNMPRAILLSIGICTVLYVAMAIVVTGMTSPMQRGEEAVVTAFDDAGMAWAGAVIGFGVVIALATVAYAFHFAMTRILQTMANDGFVPSLLGSSSPRKASWIVGLITIVCVSLFPLTAVVQMSVLASMAIYVMVSATVVRLRRGSATKTAFRVPITIHVLAILGFIVMAGIGLPVVILLLFVAWMGLGLAIYGFWGHRSSVAAMPS